MWIVRVKSAYEKVWGGFVSACEQSNCVVKPKLFSEAIHCKTNTDGRSFIRSVIYLQGLRFRGAVTSEKIDVLIRSEETLSKSCQEMEKSCVTVAYLTVDKSVAKLHQSIHYDYEGCVKPAHPWFHAQLGADFLDDQDRKRVGCTHEINKDQCSPIKTLRISTSHMGLASVLVGLAADHLKEPFFKDLLSRTQREQNNFPPPRFQRFQMRLRRKPANYMNLHWFDESH